MTARKLRNVLNRGNTGSTVWADTAYRSNKNEEWLERNGYVSDISPEEVEGPADARRHVAGQWLALKDPRIRQARLRPSEGANETLHSHHWHRPRRTKIGMTNLAYNLMRFVWHEGRSASMTAKMAAEAATAPKNEQPLKSDRVREWRTGSPVSAYQAIDACPASATAVIRAAHLTWPPHRSIVLWNTVYLDRALTAITKAGRKVDEALLPHIAPLGWKHINLTGDYRWSETPPLDDDGYRQFRRFNVLETMAA